MSNENDDKVVSLASRRVETPGPTPIDAPTVLEPVPELVAMLEGHLALAKSGELRAIAVAYISRNAVGTFWVDPNDTKVRMELLAGSDLLHNRILLSIDQEVDYSG